MRYEVIGSRTLSADQHEPQVFVWHHPLPIDKLRRSDRQNKSRFSGYRADGFDDAKGEGREEGEAMKSVKKRRVGRFSRNNGVVGDKSLRYGEGSGQLGSSGAQSEGGGSEEKKGKREDLPRQGCEVDAKDNDNGSHSDDSNSSAPRIETYVSTATSNELADEDGIGAADNAQVAHIEEEEEEEDEEGGGEEEEEEEEGERESLSLSISSLIDGEELTADTYDVDEKMGEAAPCQQLVLLARQDPRIGSPDSIPKAKVSHVSTHLAGKTFVCVGTTLDPIWKHKNGVFRGKLAIYDVVRDDGEVEEGEKASESDTKEKEAGEIHHQHQHQPRYHGNKNESHTGITSEGKSSRPRIRKRTCGMQFKLAAQAYTPDGIKCISGLMSDCVLLGAGKSVFCITLDRKTKTKINAVGTAIQVRHGVVSIATHKNMVAVLDKRDGVSLYAVHGPTRDFYLRATDPYGIVNGKEVKIIYHGDRMRLVVTDSLGGVGIFQYNPITKEHYQKYVKQQLSRFSRPHERPRFASYSRHCLSIGLEQLGYVKLFCGLTCVRRGSLAVRERIDLNFEHPKLGLRNDGKRKSFRKRSSMYASDFTRKTTESNERHGFQTTIGQTNCGFLVATVAGGLHSFVPVPIDESSDDHRDFFGCSSIRDPDKGEGRPSSYRILRWLQQRMLVFKAFHQLLGVKLHANLPKKRHVSGRRVHGVLDGDLLASFLRIPERLQRQIIVGNNNAKAKRMEEEEEDKGEETGSSTLCYELDATGLPLEAIKGLISSMVRRSVYQLSSGPGNQY